MMALYLHSQLGQPVPAHALTEAAETARKAVRSLPRSRLVQEVTKRGITMQPARAPLTRREVEEAYVHPAPEIAGRIVDPVRDRALMTGSLGAFATKAQAAGADVKVTVARGTTLPKWHVNAPDSKPNPGPPVDPSQYHGEVVDSVVVWAKNRLIYTADLRNLRIRLDPVQVRAEWHNGRIHEVTVNGAKSSLKAALEALGGVS